MNHWDLFEPALARLDWHKPSSVVEFKLEAINAVGVNSVWARDLLFGACNLNYSQKIQFMRIRSVICYKMSCKVAQKIIPRFPTIRLDHRRPDGSQQIDPRPP